MKTSDLSLYIHIPFCVRKCSYCDFLSFPGSQELQKRYFKALIREVRELSARYQGAMVRSIFIGGGTPSYPDHAYICELMEILWDSFHIDANAEISMESNPGTIKRDAAMAYAKAGINRISIGLQSADDKELAMLGRIHTYREFLQGYELIREAGFQNVNVDIMSALPGQSFESYMQTLDKVVSLKPEHISAYSLIIEEGTPFWNIYGDDHVSATHSLDQSRFAPLPDEDTERRMYHATKSFLSEHGYHRYEISNYARGDEQYAGYECYHNKVYWRRGDYLGIGLGASSMVDNTRWKNTDDLNQYIAHTDCEELREGIEQLSINAQIEEFMFLGLRLTRGVSGDEFQKLYHRSIEDVYGSIIYRFVDEGLMKITDGWYSLTQRGMDVSNMVMSEFLMD